MCWPQSVHKSRSFCSVREVIEDTLATLKFVKLASQVKLIPLEKIQKQGDSLPQISKLSEEVKYLKKILHVKSQGGGISELVYRLKALQDENSLLKTQLRKQTQMGDSTETEGVSHTKYQQGMQFGTQLSQSTGIRTERSVGYLIPMPRSPNSGPLGGLSARASPNSRPIMFSSEKLKPSIFAMAGESQTHGLHKITSKQYPKLQPIHANSELSVRSLSSNRDVRTQQINSFEGSGGSPTSKVSKWLLEDSIKPGSVNPSSVEMGESPVVAKSHLVSRKPVLSDNEISRDSDILDDKETVKNYREGSLTQTKKVETESPIHVRKISGRGPKQEKKETLPQEESPQDLRFKGPAGFGFRHSEEMSSHSPKHFSAFKLRPKQAIRVAGPVPNQRELELLKLQAKLERIESDIPYDADERWQPSSHRAKVTTEPSQYFIKDNFLSKQTPIQSWKSGPKADDQSAHYDTVPEGYLVSAPQFSQRNNLSETQKSDTGRMGQPKKYSHDWNLTPSPNVVWGLSSPPHKRGQGSPRTERSPQSDKLLEQVDQNLKKIKYEMARLRLGKQN